MLHLKVYILG
uniref:Uncharacterized protein n=1 Tax=Rhizophora mucronata TaxID=61149 RepID=A0A2P2PUD5_RHIMU